MAVLAARAVTPLAQAHRAVLAAVAAIITRLAAQELPVKAIMVARERMTTMTVALAVAVAALAEPEEMGQGTYRERLGRVLLRQYLAVLLPTPPVDWVVPTRGVVRERLERLIAESAAVVGQGKAVRVVPVALALSS